ncbi:hypothetical protein [Paraburkholderia youngii]|uniref:hypothetical protein n=1 Tax=Paraburkholderia youngii TaxID=2782701 RepID=UPI003D23E714
MTDAADQIEQQLRDWCREHHVSLSALDEIGEADAARLLGVTSACLRRQFHEGRSAVPPARVVFGRRQYALQKIAAYLANGANRALDG